MNLAARPVCDFDALVREHQDRVYRIACRVLRDPAGAEDVAQQVFLKLYQDGGLPSGVVNPAAYVARAAVNTALKAIRGEGRRDLREQAARPRTAPNASVGLAVREAVDELPSDLRLPVVLHYFEGLGYQEVSDTLGVPAGTVAWRISEAKGKLRASLAGIGAALTVASLDSALSAAELETAPSTLAARLRTLPRPPRAAAVPPPPLPAGPILGMGLPAAIALLLFFTAALVVVVVKAPSTTLTRRTANLPSPTTTTPASATKPGETAPSEAQAPALAVAPQADTVAAATVSEVQGVEGFLFRHPSGRIGVESYQDLEDRFPDRLLRPDSAARFAGVDLGGRDVNDVRWGKSGKETSPRVHVRLRAVLAHEEGTSGGPGIDWVDVKEWVGVELLSDAWIDAWQRNGKVFVRLVDLLDEAPGEEKRARLQALVAESLREIQTLARLRSLDERPAELRGLPYDDRFRRNEVVLLYGVLEGFAAPYCELPKDLPTTPDPEEVRRMFLEAKDQASFRLAIVQRWSEEVFAPEMEAFCPLPSAESEEEIMRRLLDQVSRPEYDPSCPLPFAESEVGIVRRLSDRVLKPEARRLCRIPSEGVSYSRAVFLKRMVDEWTPMRFAEEQERARAEAATETQKTGPSEAELKALQRAFEGTGIEPEAVSEEEERAFMRINVFRAKSMTPGGLADRAGVRQGDLLWGVEDADRVHADGRPDLSSAAALADAMRGAREKGRDTVTLIVLRDGVLVPIRIPVR